MTPGLNRKLLDCVACMSSSQETAVSTATQGPFDSGDGGAGGVPSAFVFPGDPLIGAVDDVLWNDFGEFTFPGMMSSNNVML